MTSLIINFMWAVSTGKLCHGKGKINLKVTLCISFLFLLLSLLVSVARLFLKPPS